MSFYKNKHILVTGGTGLIGRPLVELLLEAGAKVRVASLDDPSRAHKEAEFMRLDLTKFDNCIKACKDVNYVFHLAGIKSTPKMSIEKPASFFVPTILFNTNMMEAARQSGVEGYLYTSTVGVYSPAEIFHENDVWKTFPSPNDWFQGWAKRMGELQAEAYQIEHNWDKISIVRPANVYGSYDNFDVDSGMVIPSLIRKAVQKEDPFTVFGDGSSIRDFVYAKDVATAMLLVAEKGYTLPLNIGNGTGCSIKDLVEIILNVASSKCPQYQPKITWDLSKPTGDKKRVMDNERLRSLGWKPQFSLQHGISETFDWYMKNKEIVEKRYDVFREHEK